MSFTLLDKTRLPVSQLLALNEDGTTLADLSAYVQSYDLTFTDELKAHQASIVLENVGAYFDKLGTGGGATYLVENRLLQLKKGFRDAVTGSVTLYPAFTGRIVHAQTGYDRKAGEIITVDLFDLMKLFLKQKVTTDPYYNTQANLIAADIITRYGDKYCQIAGFNLAALDYPFGFVQWPDTLLIDILREIYEPQLYFVFMGYDGRPTTRPRLGGGGASFLGYPDQITQPTAGFVFPDDTLIHMVSPEWQDATDFVNQVRVLGQELTESVTLGPSQLLTTLGDPNNVNFLSAGGGVGPKRLYFSQQTGGANAVTAQNVFLKIGDPSFSNDTGGIPFKYLATGPGIVNDVGQVIPFPVYEQAFPPGHQNVKSRKGDGRTEGGVALVASAPNFVDVFAFANSDGGGFEWDVAVYGQPVLTSQATITAIADLDPIGFTETLTDAFGDHQTYQGSHAPWAMGTPVSLTVNGASYGTNAADGTQLDTRFQVDWERGRVVLQNRLFLPFTADSLFTGGFTGSTSFAYNLTLLTNPAPLSVYQTFRQCAYSSAFTYTFTGLQVGRGYTVRLHLADPVSTGSGQRVFNVYANGAPAAENVDIFALANGKGNGAIQEITGVQPDASGNLVLSFQNGDGGGVVGQGGAGLPLCCGIEITLPQGTGGVAFAVNCGGGAITPAAPTVAATGAFSASQQIYGVNQVVDDNPLLCTLPQCQNMAQYLLNYASWARQPLNLRTASIPTLYAGQVLQFYHRRINADLSVYVEGIKRHQHRPDPQPNAEDECDYDDFSTYLLFVKPR